MKKIYRDQNYIVIEANGQISAFPASLTIYSNIISGNNDQQDAAFLISSIDRIRFVIIEAEVIKGDWQDDRGTIYDIKTIVQFLRINTGY
tara:strand:+ start:621 stop:890 length:270 start_codon:yes stop_codon:yes gene_type:complete